MSNELQNQQLPGLIALATKCMYSHTREFTEIVDTLSEAYPNAALDTIYVAIRAVYKMQANIEAEDTSPFDSTEQDLLDFVIEKCETILHEIVIGESDVELSKLLKERNYIKASMAFDRMQLYFVFSEVSEEDSYPGLIFQLEESQYRPANPNQRRWLKQIASKLAKNKDNQEAP